MEINKKPRIICPHCNTGDFIWVDFEQEDCAVCVECEKSFSIDENAKAVAQ